MKLKTIAYAALLAAATAAFAFGTASDGFAKGKKMMAEPPAQPMPCMYAPPGPVCGSLKGHKFNYANACAAYKDGASVVSQGACKMHKAKAHKKAMKAAKKPAAKKKM